MCQNCHDRLRKGSDDNLLSPCLSYANGLWYGPQPGELRTLPEILFTFLNYHRIFKFLVKLRPQTKD